MTKMENENMVEGELENETSTSDTTSLPTSDMKFENTKCEERSLCVKIATDIRMTCAKCNHFILDKYYMKVDEKAWHEACVHCVSCLQPLLESCFSKNSNLYCKECYERLQYCSGCFKPIAGKDFVMRVGPDTYHTSCFVCDECKSLLQIGDLFHLLDGDKKRKICCRTCFEVDSDTDESLNDPHSPSLYTNPYTSSAMTNYVTQPPDYVPQMCYESPSASSTLSPSDSKRSKRPRTILTTAQRRKFKASFEISQKPCRKVRETLANETGLTPRVVQVWFQNQRAKIKKMARRQNQCDNRQRRGKKIKDEDSDSENEVSSSPGSYASAPTPTILQGQYFAEYPLTIPASTTQQKIIPKIYSPAYCQSRCNFNESYFDGSNATSSTHDGMMTRHDSPSHSPSQLEMHHMLHERMCGMEPYMPTATRHEPILRQENVRMHQHDQKQALEAPGGFSNVMYLPHQSSESVDMSPENIESNVTLNDASTPIDSLVHMQTNFFGV